MTSRLPATLSLYYGQRMGRARFADAGFNSADARDGTLLPVVIGHNGLHFRL